MAKQFHLPEMAKYVEKSTPARAFFCDVCPIQMHTDLALHPRRYLPGQGTMFANKSM